MPLLTTKTLPPGAWHYDQHRPDGSLFQHYRGQGPFSDFCNEVLAGRIANGFPRATYDEVSMDVQDYTCQRLGNDPRHCRGGAPQTAAATTAPAKAEGKKCGTCGGRKKLA